MRSAPRRRAAFNHRRALAPLSAARTGADHLSARWAHSCRRLAASRRRRDASGRRAIYYILFCTTITGPEIARGRLNRQECEPFASQTMAKRTLGERENVPAAGQRRRRSTASAGRCNALRKRRRRLRSILRAAGGALKWTSRGMSDRQVRTASIRPLAPAGRREQLN